MKKYDSYKDSGIEWIGEIPSHWEIKRFGHLFSFSRGLGITKQDLKDEGIPCVNYGEIHSKYGFAVNPEIHPLKCVEESYLETADKSFLRRGDFVFADTSEDIEGSGNFTVLDSDLPTFAGYHTVIARHENGNDYKYLAYCFDSLGFRNQIRSTVTGIKVFSITQSILKSSKVQLPSYPEQTAIASYLDRKTAEIDELIADKKRLLELYEEEKTAIINDLVTGKIVWNGHAWAEPAEVKDSGIEWLGEIPRHWVIRRGRFLFEIRKRIAGELGYDVLSITQKGIKVKDIKNLDGQISSDYSKYQLVENGDFAMNSMDLLTGYVDLSDQLGVTSPDYRVFSLIDEESIPAYYLHILQLCYLRRIFYGLGRGAALFGRWRFPAQEFKDFWYPRPEPEEQRLIVNHIKSEFARIDLQVSRTQKLIDLLTQYRTALISEVVTGKVKVTD